MEHDFGKFQGANYKRVKFEKTEKANCDLSFILCHTPLAFLLTVSWLSLAIICPRLHYGVQC